MPPKKGITWQIVSQLEALAVQVLENTDILPPLMKEAAGDTPIAQEGRDTWGGVAIRMDFDWEATKTAPNLIDTDGKHTFQELSCMLS